MAHTELVSGWHAVRVLLQRAPERVLTLRILDGRDDARTSQLLALANTAGSTVRRVSRDELDRALGAGPHSAHRHQGVIAELRQRPALNDSGLDDLLDGLDSVPLLLVLDQVQDPHNLGACLRVADAAGVAAVIAPRNRSAGLGPAARKVACGAAETVAFVQVTNLARCLRGLNERGIAVVGTAGTASLSVYDADLRGPLAIVMGGEAAGLRRLTREHCSALVALPMLGAVESLNISVAAGVFVYEALRQRRDEAGSAR